jgi:hypothetical protein
MSGHGVRENQYERCINSVAHSFWLVMVSLSKATVPFRFNHSCLSVDSMWLYTSLSLALSFSLSPCLHMLSAAKIMWHQRWIAVVEWYSQGKTELHRGKHVPVQLCQSQIHMDGHAPLPPSPGFHGENTATDLLNHYLVLLCLHYHMLLCMHLVLLGLG